MMRLSDLIAPRELIGAPYRVQPARPRAAYGWPVWTPGTPVLVE